MNLQDDLIDVFDNITKFMDTKSLGRLSCVSKTCNELAKKELLKRPFRPKYSNLSMAFSLIRVEECIEDDNNWNEDNEVEMDELATFITECKEKCTPYHFDINKFCEEYGEKIHEMARALELDV